MCWLGIVLAFLFMNLASIFDRKVHAKTKNMEDRWNSVETIGSIVYLKEGSQKLMIINRGPIVEIEGQKYLFDYSACKYPVGVVEDQIYYFN